MPKLYEEYVSKAGVEINKLALYFGSKKIITSSGAAGADDENYLVDRNHVTAALARYLNEHFKSSSHLVTHYHTKLNFVDSQTRRVHVRSAAGEDRYLPYDLLVGADGVRSGVRAALVANHRDFECSVQDIFERFKSVHLDLPEGMEPNCMHVFPSALANMNGIGLCETGGRINISMGHRRHAPCDDALRSSDPMVVSTYLREHFKAVPNLPFDEWAAAWVAMDWQTTTMTHCNYYHSTKLALVIIGDAAHATSPSIGMGMNHAYVLATGANRALATPVTPTHLIHWIPLRRPVGAGRRGGPSGMAVGARRPRPRAPRLFQWLAPIAQSISAPLRLLPCAAGSATRQCSTSCSRPTPPTSPVPYPPSRRLASKRATPSPIWRTSSNRIPRGRTSS